MSYSTQHSDVFQDLDAERILSAVESSGRRATGRILQLNSMENRVFSVEIESEKEGARPHQVIAKFYRPGRWSADAILSEHLLQLLLAEEEIPTPKLLPILDNRIAISGSHSPCERLIDANACPLPEYATLGKSGPYNFCLWEKVAGRSPLELKPQDLEQLGRIVARMHNLFERCINPTHFVGRKINPLFDLFRLTPALF